MVKNTTGGSKTKGQARKLVTAKAGNSLRLSQDESEIYAQVIKVLGGSMCHVNDADGKIMLCHIRGKFRGRGKRDNFVGNGTWVLVGLREWETSNDKEGSGKKKLENCDLLEVYNEQDKDRLKNTVTTINWCLFVSNDTKTTNDDDIGIEFSDEKTEEYRQLIEAQIIETKSGNSTSIIPDEKEIDIDDI
jgi:translation initiation factor IF-1